MSFSVFDIAGSGMNAQRIKMDTISSNIANVNTTRNEYGQKEVYRKKEVNFKEMAIKSGFKFPSGNAAVEFEPPQAPFLVGGVNMQGEAVSSGVAVDSITDSIKEVVEVQFHLINSFHFRIIIKVTFK